MNRKKKQLKANILVYIMYAFNSEINDIGRVVLLKTVRV